MLPQRIKLTDPESWCRVFHVVGAADGSEARTTKHSLAGTPTMRDAMALQRRRRLMLLQTELPAVDVSTGAPGSAGTDLPSASGQLTSSSIETDLDLAALDSFARDAAGERFFRECGGRTGVQLLVELPGVAQPARVGLDRPFLLIGRDPACDLRLDHPDVSPRHAYLQWLGGHLFCTDLGDETSLLPSRRKAGLGPWVERQPLQAGPCRMSLVGGEPQSPPASSPLERSPQLAAEFPQVRLKFDGVEQDDNQWPVDRALTLIGRGAQCKLRLNHPDMPLVQASLVRTPAGCWLIDLAGAGTTLVNDRSIQFAQLDIGDVLQLGAFRVMVTAAAFGVVAPKAAPGKTVPFDQSLVELATRHRELLGELNEDLKDVQSYLDTELLDDAPQLKASLEQYVRRANRHQREMFESLEPLAKVPLRTAGSASR